MRVFHVENINNAVVTTLSLYSTEGTDKYVDEGTYLIQKVENVHFQIYHVKKISELQSNRSYHVVTKTASLCKNNSYVKSGILKKVMNTKFNLQVF